MDKISAHDLVNFNVGILGHVDSGKTTLAKALSTTASTASFDKNPQSQERGITLDLGFSSLTVDMPGHLLSSCGNNKYVQYTFVDCPGHASLIRTIIGGSQIIDLMLLVVDVTKGVQTQTAECLIIGEVTCSKMIVVLNKIDLLAPEKRDAIIAKMSRKMKATLVNSVFKDSPVVPVAAKSDDQQTHTSIGLELLVDTLKASTFMPQRDKSQSFLLAVDHCFPIRGKGTVLTGTVLQGSVSLNDTVEIPSLGITKKVKSLQMFRRPVEVAAQGDRVGMLVTQLDPKSLERGLVCQPGSVPSISAVVALVTKIPYFKGTVRSKTKLHVSLGHETVMTRVNVFGEPGTEDFEPSKEYCYQEELSELPQLVLLEFEQPVLVPPSRNVVIGSRLDGDVHSSSCRLAFHGRLLAQLTDTRSLLVYKEKSRVGSVQRVAGQNEVVVVGLFHKQTNLQLFLGMKVCLSTGEEGVIQHTFGQGGKVKVHVPGGLMTSTVDKLAAKKLKKTVLEGPADPVHVTLHFKKFMYDPDKRMVQT